MKLHYDQETDSSIFTSTRVSVDSREIKDSLMVEFDREGRAVGIDIQHAS